jgi:AbrB family looped-hinge helix DNA binding protein
MNYNIKYHNTMKISIDGAGRILVPKTLRERFNLVGGTETDIEADPNGLHLRVHGGEPSLSHKQRVVVHQGSEKSNIDITDLICNERESRGRSIVDKAANR